MAKKRPRRKRDAHWNNRIVRKWFAYSPVAAAVHGLKGEWVYGLHEAYYDRRSSKVPYAITREPVRVQGNDPGDCWLGYLQMLGAFRAPVLDWKTRREVEPPFAQRAAEVFGELPKLMRNAVRKRRKVAK